MERNSAHSEYYSEIGMSQNHDLDLDDPGRVKRFNMLQIEKLRGNAYIPVLLIFISFILFVTSLKRIDLDAMSDYGLISVIPFSIFAAIALLTISFVYALNQAGTKTWMLALHVLLLILILYGITIFIEEVPRFNVTWRHVGIVDYIMRMGNVQEKIDAYFEWPGFFIFNALLTNAAGWNSLLRVVSWTPILYNLLYLGALIMIYQSVTKDKRLVWLSVWFFYITNWIGQDYFSPQGQNYFLYLIVIGVLLLWFRRRTQFAWLDKITLWVRQRLNREENQVADISPAASISAEKSLNPFQQSGLFIILILIIFVMITSHQLTPFALFASMVALALFRQISLRNILFVTGLLILTWLSFGTVAYLKGHLGGMLDNIGEITSVVSHNLTNRILGNEAHLFILKIRMFFTIAVWMLAVYGIIRTIQKGTLDLGIALPAAVPFGLIALQNYGGEMLLRIFLFTLPFMAFYGASLFYPSIKQKGNWIWSLAIGTLSIIFIVGFFLARYGDEKIYQYTQNEVRAVHVLNQISEEDSIVIVPSSKYPEKFQAYEKLRYRFMADEIYYQDLETIIDTVSGAEQSSYFILTNSQKSYFRLYMNFNEEDWQDFEQQMLKSERFYLAYENPDAKIYKFVP